ncbi:hypothetical protein QQF64_023943 [Cirrhinus molitorella]|uniref:Uncharacterized protein n=1 Tax=Cirrhinus molitorella TaxID=172907 RepID=A0ABR3MV34_9TELE
MALLHWKGEPHPMLNKPGDLKRVMEGLLLCPKGAVALLHRKEESPLRSLMPRMEGSHCDRREPRLRCTRRESLVCHRVRRITQMADG